MRRCPIWYQTQWKAAKKGKNDDDESVFNRERNKKKEILKSYIPSHYSSNSRATVSYAVRLTSRIFSHISSKVKEKTSEKIDIIMRSEEIDTLAFTRAVKSNSLMFCLRSCHSHSTEIVNRSGINTKTRGGRSKTLSLTIPAFFYEWKIFSIHSGAADDLQITNGIHTGAWWMLSCTYWIYYYILMLL